MLLMLFYFVYKIGQLVLWDKKAINLVQNALLYCTAWTNTITTLALHYR